MRLAFLAIAMMIHGPALAANPYCSTGYCAPKIYHTPTYAAPVVKNYITPPPVYVPAPQVSVVVVPVGIPVQYQQPLAKLNYTYSAAQGTYPYLDPAFYLQQSGKLAELSSANNLEANQLFHEAASQIKENDAAIARFALVERAFSRALEDSRLTTSTQYYGQKTSSLGSNGVGVPPVPQAGQVFNSIDAILSNKCVQCHPGYSKWDEMDNETQRSIRKRVMSHNPAVRMPQGAGASKGQPIPGTPLVDAELDLFID